MGAGIAALQAESAALLERADAELSDAAEAFRNAEFLVQATRAEIEAMQRHCFTLILSRLVKVQYFGAARLGGGA